MPVEIVLYQEADGFCPLLEFLDRQPDRVRLQAIQRVELLAEHGHRLRRPHSDYLEDGIHELRWHSGRIQYRILYFFHGRRAAVLVHALIKERVIPRPDLERALHRMARFSADPVRHTHSGGSLRAGN